VALRTVWDVEKIPRITSKPPSKQQDIVNNLATTYKSVQARTQFISSSTGNQQSPETSSGRDFHILHDNDGLSLDAQSFETVCDDTAFELDDEREEGSNYFTTTELDGDAVVIDSINVSSLQGESNLNAAPDSDDERVEGPSHLTSREMDFLENTVANCKKGKNVDWPEVERLWKVEVRKNDGIFKRKILRIKSSHKSRKEEQARKKLRVTSNEFEEQPTSNDGIVESIQAIQSGIISVASSSESLYSDHLGSTSVSLSSHITQSPVQSSVHDTTMISTFDPPTLSSIFPSSTSSSLSTSLVTSDNVTYPSATVVSTVAPDRIWKRKDVTWSKEEKAFITNFGLSCLNKATKKEQKVRGTALFDAYKKEEQFAGYLREGDHMKEYWKGWIALNKKKI
jgi:hypothetical protein